MVVVILAKDQLMLSQRLRLMLVTCMVDGYGLRLGYGGYGYGRGFYGRGYYGKRDADAEPEADAGYYGGYGYRGYGGYGGYGFGRGFYGRGYYGKRDADAEPE